MNDETPLGTFEEQVMLAVVRTTGDAYGMVIRREIEEVTGREIAVGAVYATLDRLEAKGLVRPAAGMSTECRAGCSPFCRRVPARSPNQKRCVSGSGVGSISAACLVRRKGPSLRHPEERSDEGSLSRQGC